MMSTMPPDPITLQMHGALGPILGLNHNSVHMYTHRHIYVCVVCICKHTCIRFSLFIHWRTQVILCLDIANDAAVNTRMQISWMLVSFTCDTHRSGMFWIDDSSLFNLWAASILFSVVTVLIYIPTVVYRVPSFLHTFSNTSSYLSSVW